jgi:hypothetical protein
VTLRPREEPIARFPTEVDCKGEGQAAGAESEIPRKPLSRPASAEGSSVRLILTKRVEHPAISRR